MPSTTAVLTAVHGILAELGKPETVIQSQALAALESGNADKLRLLAASNLADNYCRSLGYLISAKLKPDLPTVAVILAEAARAAADHRKDFTMAQLSGLIAEALSREPVLHDN
jgi:hypothetical protein